MFVRFILAVAAGAVLSGCAGLTTVRSDISEFHSLSAPSAEDSFVVLPWRKELEGSLEFKSYAEQVASGLRTRGYNVVAPPSPAKFALFLDYGIDQGRTETSSYSIPQYGVTGYSGSTTTGTVSTFGNTSYLNARTTTTPQYGVTGYQQGIRSSQVYRRFINVDIVELVRDSAAPNKVYEGKLRSEGKCGTLSAVMPALIQSLLVRFPGETGKSRRETVPLGNAGC